MHRSTSQRDRETEAREDLGGTAVSRGTAAFLVAGFLLTVVGLPLLQTVEELRAGRWNAVEPLRSLGAAAASLARGTPPLEANRTLVSELRRFEATLEEESVFGRHAFPWAQLALTSTFRAGNNGASVGRDDTLFLRSAMDYTLGPPFLSKAALARRRAAADAPREADPRVAILQFQQQVEARGARLLLVLSPEKQQLMPTALAPGYQGPVPQNASLAPMLQQLAAAGVEVFDPAPLLTEWSQRTGKPAFLKTDAHWSPEAMEQVAEALAARIRGLGVLPETEPAGYVRAEPETLTGRGDILTVLRLPPGHGPFAAETVEIHPVRTAQGDAWQPEREADLLVLGNSFSNIYSQQGLGFGESAGLVEQLALRLQRPIDTLLRNGKSSNATREMLARELARGRDRLKGKRVVVWQFALRELAIGDWRPVPLELGQAPQRRYLSLSPGQSLTVRGTLAALSPIPRPGTTPYKDQLRSARVIDLEGPDGPLPGVEALVYAWGMTDGRWTPFGRQRVGQPLTFRLRPWAEREQELERVARSELDDDDLLSAEPLFAEEVLP